MFVRLLNKCTRQPNEESEAQLGTSGSERFDIGPGQELLPSLCRMTELNFWMAGSGPSLYKAASGAVWMEQSPTSLGFGDETREEVGKEEKLVKRC